MTAMEYILLCGFLGIYFLGVLTQPVAANCYTMGGVPSDTIEVRMTTKKVVPKGRRPSENDNATYDLQAQVFWGRPVTENGYDDFEVWLGLEQPKFDISCDPMDDGLSTNNQTWYTFKNLYHGFLYYFQVRTYSAKTDLYQSSRTQHHFITPDCFQETDDLNYCSGRIVEAVSAPPFFSLSSVTAEFFHSIHVTGFLEWSRPLQINGTLLGFNLIYQVQGSSFGSRKTANLLISDGELLKTGDDSFGYRLSGLVNNEVYVFELNANSRNGQQTATGAKTSITVSMNITDISKNVQRVAPNLDLLAFDADDGEESAIEVETPTQGSMLDSWQPWTVIAGSSIVMFTVVACCLRCMIRRRKGARTDQLLAEINKQKVHHISGSLGEIKETVKPDIAFEGRELDRTLLTLDRELGSGQFGVVYKAYAFGVNGAKEFVPVAVKCLKEAADLAMKEDFLDEIKLLIEIDDHPNILSVLGCCTMEEPYYLITEYMRYGDLLRFLWKSREERYRIQDAVYDITQQNRLQIARQVARGMEYLSKTRYYHGDLAARNILVGENLVVKISDFGLADDIYQAGYKRLAPDKKRPVKWVSLETNTTGKCTIQSDVWSYGIVLYEIYTSGGVPYPGISGRELIQKLQDGYRMERPEECSDEIYEVMLSCWQANPSDRPTFNTIYRIMDCLLAERSDYLTTDEEKSVHRILPLIKKTSSSGTSVDRNAPAIPERPRDTLGEESDEYTWSEEADGCEEGDGGSRECLTGQDNESFHLEDEEAESDREGTSLETLIELEAEQDADTKL